MDYKELDNYVRKARNGDKEAMLLIIDTFKPFIFKAAAKYKIQSNDFYDLQQTATLALLNSINKYKLGRNTFKSYAYATILNSLKYLARQNKKTFSSLNEKLQGSNVEYISVLLDQTDIEDNFMRKEEKEVLRKVISTLDKEEIELIYSLYHFGISLKTYAEKKNIAYITAVRRKNRALKNLKDKLIPL